MNPKRTPDLSLNINHSPNSLFSVGITCAEVSYLRRSAWTFKNGSHKSRVLYKTSGCGLRVELGHRCFLLLFCFFQELAKGSEHLCLWLDADREASEGLDLGLRQGQEAKISPLWVIRPPVGILIRQIIFHFEVH